MTRAPVCAWLWVFMMASTGALGCYGEVVSTSGAVEDVSPSETLQEPPEELVPAAELEDYLPGPSAMRRLTRVQYVASVRAIFGEDLEVLPPIEVDLRVEGLFTVGGGTTTVTPAGLERYELSARQIAASVLSVERRAALLTCEPVSETEPDDICAAEFVDAVAPLVLRRALLSGEVEAYVGLARSATGVLGGFYQGLEAVLSAWLLTPDFLFIQERMAPGGGDETGTRLTGESLASRLSYFFWNQGPDRELLDAGLNGELETEAGYLAAIDRLLADHARLEGGIRALFTDLYDLDALANVTKDSSAFPQFTSGVIEDAREQTLRTIVDHLLTQGADYRDLFTTRKTFMTRNLGPIYNVPVAEDWEAYEFPEGDERAGILTQVSFLALHARSSRSSPVLRGEFVLDKILCSKIPPPPPDVNFDTLTPGDPSAPTARERLAAHRVEPSCAGCHDIIDPIGLAFENFDAVGQFRTHEGGAEIETYGEVADTPYDDVQGLHRALRDAPRVSQCLVQQLYMHAVGREFVQDEQGVLDSLTADFASANYAFVALMKNIALTHGFRATSGPKEEGE